jgi:hypothetical protein
VKYPFDYVHVTSKLGCDPKGPEVTDSFSTGFAPTSYMFTVIVGISMIYCVAAIAFYVFKHHDYDLEKRLPAIDLLASLAVGIFWAITTYLGWHNFSDLKKNTSPDNIQMQATLCKDKNAYCSNFNGGNWNDMNTYLFLSIANVLSWGISVWFIFMETGLCPEDDEDVQIVDSEYGAQPPTFVPFPELMEKKGEGYPDATGPNGDEDNLMTFIKKWKNVQGAEMAEGEDRFANGYTFTPVVPSVSESVHNRENTLPMDKEVKVHNKWNVFQA